MFVLGFLVLDVWPDMESTNISWKKSLRKKPDILESNLKVLHAGYNYGDTTETFTTQYHCRKSKDGSRQLPLYYG